MIDITTGTTGTTGTAAWNGLYAEGSSRAEALSRLLLKIEKAYPELAGAYWVAPDSGASGRLGEKAQRRQRPGRSRGGAELPLVGGRMGRDVA